MTQQVLLIEDDDMCAFLVESQLHRHDTDAYEMSRATTLREALAHIHNAPVDLILLDLGLPDSEGVHAISRLKEAAPQIPIVVLTANEDENLPVEAIGQGAQEYLSKEHVVGRLLIRAIRLSMARQKQLNRALADALIDPLTGLANRRAFDLELRRLEAGMIRNPAPYCVAMIDIDHFKQVNDTWGHEMGDLALTQVAQAMRSICRQDDTVSRYGGEEFALALPNTSLPNAVNIMERIRVAIARKECRAAADRFSITVSTGVAGRENSKPEAILADADQALYLAKAEGRNCIRTAADVTCS
jgi:diguanylate cyclase (GGDEF)-like protein